jgi:hypothetical protein
MTIPSGNEDRHKKKRIVQKEAMEAFSKKAKSVVFRQTMPCVALCGESCTHGVRREARYGIPAASRRNGGEVPGLLAYLEVKAEGDQACQASGACSKAL